MKKPYVRVLVGDPDEDQINLRIETELEHGNRLVSVSAYGDPATNGRVILLFDGRPETGGFVRRNTRTQGGPE